MLVINLWGAPSSGKSTTAAGLFFLMKINKYKVEQITEFAKELVWDQHHTFFGDQVSIFAEQNHRLVRLEDHNLDFAITDSPLPLPAFYKDPGYLKTFDGLVMEQFNRYNNLNYLLKRTHSFEAIGRRHDENEAKEIEKSLELFMIEHGITYQVMDANPQTPQTIFDDVLSRLPKPVPMPLVPPENQDKK